MINVSDALNTEKDSIQAHSHFHSFNDPGHQHSYVDKYPTMNTGEDGYWGPVTRYSDQIADRYDKSHTSTSYSRKTDITMSVNGVSNARTSFETKPKNMNVVYIMKVC